MIEKNQSDEKVSDQFYDSVRTTLLGQNNVF